MPIRVATRLQAAPAAYTVLLPIPTTGPIAAPSDAAPSPPFRRRRPAAAGRAAGARPGPAAPHRRLRHRPARLRRPAAVLHLPARPRPRTGRRGPVGTDQSRRETWRPLRRRAVSVLRDLPPVP